MRRICSLPVSCLLFGWVTILLILRDILGSARPPMIEKMFDESYNVRDVLDKLVEGVELREKLMQTAKQFADKKREERFVLAVKQFENVMADFLKLWQPVLDKVRAYREQVQAEISRLMGSFMTVNGMLEVSRGVEFISGSLQQMEAESQELDRTIKEKSKTVEKIDDLFRRIKPYLGGATTFPSKEPLSDALDDHLKDLGFDLPETTKSTSSPRKTSART